MTAPPDDSAADLQAVITALRAERDAALAQKAALARELGAEDVAALKVENHELRAAQAAGLEVLQAMIASPGDTQPVFDLIARQAANLCEVPIAAVGLFDGTMVHLATQSGFDAAYADVFAKQFPRSPSPDFAMGRAILNRRVEQIEDTGADTRRGFSPPPGPGSALAVPLLRNGTPLGVIAVGRRARGSFSRNQITLLQTFAEQAVIAISSAETYRALRARTSDLQESLEQQTATAEVLQVINASPGDLAPVFDAMLEKALRLCDATFGVFWQRDGESFYPAALHGVPKAFADHLMRNPVRPSPNSGVGRTARGEPFVHITDIADSDAYRSGDPQRRALVDLGGGRTALWVGLRGDGRVPGVFTIYRKEVRPFTDKQIALLQNFAAQAVIAMENARLITEQREALEQQTATAEVLQVINASPGNLVPVFDAILEKAVRLCESSFGILAAYDGECFHNVAERGAPPALADILREPMRSTPGTSVHRIVHGEDVVHVPDIVDDEAYRAGNPARRALADLGGGRTQLVVALRKDETLLGLINVYRREVRPFTDKQIALLRNFAAQAVIAMENARLLTEQQEALEQQTATAEVLQVINASPGNLAPVFDAMLEKAIRLCGSSFGSLATYDGEAFHVVAMRGVPPALAEFFRAPILPVPGMTLYRTVHDEDVVHVADLTDDEIYRSGNPARRAIADLGGARTQLLVALRKDHTLLGAFNVFRQDVRPFSDKQIALLENFAAQAVIAMENARLLTEQQEALEQQTATAEVLGVINASPGNLAPVFEAILNKAHALCGAALGSLASYDGEVFSRLATHGYPPEYEALVRPPNKPLPHLQRLLDGARFVHDADLAVALPWNTDDPYRRAAVEIVGIRTALFVPLRKDGRLLGYISAQRREVRPFSEKEIALLENFAAQAVIAMENARLINEQREALEQQTATAEVLQVINASPGNLAPVFDAVLERALRLCGASFGTLATYDGEHLERVAFLGVPPAFIDYNQRNPLTKNAALVAQGIATGKPVQATDIMTDERLASSPSVRDALVELGGVRALLQVPLLKDGGVVGFIGVWRREPGVFPDRQVALVEGFAAQAVIAMENARLLTEQQEALEQQTATAEVLQVINASPGNLAPVFDAMLEKAMRLCEAQFGVLSTYDGERFRRVASHGMPVAETQGWPEGIVPDPGSALERVVNGDRVVHILDLVDTDAYRQGVGSRLSLVATTGARSALWVGLRKDDALLGVFVIYRREVRAFSDRQIALVRNFADQAVIAIENTRLLTEQREALEQQTATAEVLQVINASPGNLTPVFDTILAKHI